MAPPGFENSSLGAPLDLQNKEVYLAQIPAKFDVNKASFKSETEVVCDGISYFVSSSAKLAPCRILNEQENGEYSVSTAHLTGLLAFTQKVQIPKPDFAEVHKPKPRVKQRTGLQMRHFATGYNRSDFGLPSSPEKKPKSSKSKDTKSKETKETKETKDLKETKETQTKETKETKETKRKHKHKDSEGRKKRRKERKSDQ